MLTDGWKYCPGCLCVRCVRERNRRFRRALVAEVWRLEYVRSEWPGLLDEVVAGMGGAEAMVEAAYDEKVIDVEWEE